jgi:hypothetical protein
MIITLIVLYDHDIITLIVLYDHDIITLIVLYDHYTDRPRLGSWTWLQC